MPRLRSIGVLAPFVGGEFFGALISGIRTTAARHGRRVLAVQTLDARLGHDNTFDSDFSSPVTWDRVDGYVVIVNAVTADYLDDLRSAGKPVVMISHQVDGFDCPVVAPDNKSGVREAVEHLLSHGHTRIAFAGALIQPDFRDRHEAYCETLRAHGIEPDPALHFDGGANNVQGGEVAGRALLAAGVPSTALVAGNDYTAFGVMKVLTEAGLSLPSDQAIIGFDDTPLAAHAVPALSSVTQHFAKAGEKAAALLLDLLEGRPVRSGRHELPTSFVARESCGCRGLATVTSAAGEDTDGAVGRPPPAMTVERAAESRVGLRLEKHLAAAARGEVPPPGPGVAEEVSAALGTARSREHVAGLVADALRVARGLRPTTDAEGQARLDRCLAELTMATVETLTRGQYDVNTRLRSSMQNEYDITLELLRRADAHPRALRWLSRTLVRGACFGEWTAPAPELWLTGFLDRDGDADQLDVRPVSAAEFPPAELMSLVDGTDDVVYVLPLRTEAHDWGFLAVAGAVEAATDTGRETYYQWAALFSVALDHEATVESLRSKGEDLAAAYGRERGLVESIRVSEERYALAARAANDGLWDWDVTTGEIYFSSRWKEMVGGAETIGSSADEWFDRVHPDDLAGLLERVAGCTNAEFDSFDYEHRIRGGAGGYLWMLCRALAVRGDGGAATRIVGSMTDVTDRKSLEDRLRQGALYDALTGLPNRTLFLERLDRAIARRRRHSDSHFVMLFLDLDGFKVVNDSLGHLAGDVLLTEVATRIRSQVRDEDTAARFGGDEFAILLNDISDSADVGRFVDRLQRELTQPYDVDGHEVVISASIGIATSTTGYLLPEDVLRDSDIAMYRAKTTGRGSYAMFDVTMHEGAVHRMQLESELRRGIDNGEFGLHYQPVVELHSGRIVAFEALIRWNHPDRGLVAPGDFLPIADETGLIVPIGRLVIAEACRQLAEWTRDGIVGPDITVSVNVSNREFWHQSFTEFLLTTVAAHGLSPSSLNVEITEGVIMHNPELARRVLVDLRTHGFHLHVDDFGTGYSSLGSLHRFPIEVLKIDRSFVARLRHDSRSRELVRTIVMMGRNLDMDVIAEGIEDAEQAAVLIDLGCALGQGYWWSRPTTASGAAELLAGGGLLRHEPVGPLPA